MRQPSEQLALVVDAFAVAGIPYAIGGAIASGVWSEPRDTQDIDIDIFLPESSADRVLDVLARAGIPIDHEAARHLRNRSEVLHLLATLPGAPAASDGEVLAFIEGRELWGRGIGYIDMRLLASALLAGAQFWTRDHRLAALAEELGTAYASQDPNRR